MIRAVRVRALTSDSYPNMNDVRDPLVGEHVVKANPVNIGNVGEDSTLSLRPERVELNPDSAEFPNIFEGEVEELIYLGDHIRTRMKVLGHNEFVSESAELRRPR